MKVVDNLNKSKTKIIKFYCKDAAKNPDAVLEQAIGQFNNVLIIGWNKEDVFECRADLNTTDAGSLVLVELFKDKLIQLLRG